jgi:hypothetical protein
MPRWSWRIGRIVIEKTAKDGKKLRKMSTGVQIWTQLEKLKVAHFAGIERRVDALIGCGVAQASAIYALPRNGVCVF